MTTVTALRCPRCDATIFSRVRHDFRSCPCGAIAIDGGFDYVRILADPILGPIKTFPLEIEQTPVELYNDWNIRKNKYGSIPGNNHE